MLFLRVGAAQYDCKVFLNGVFLGNHVGGSTPFFCELTDHLREGRNWLMLMVNNARTLDRVPMRNTDWFNYGGVYREVALYETPKTVIRDLFVHLVPDGSDSRIRAEVEVEGATSARLEIAGLGIACDIPLDAGGRGEVTLEAAPELWSPENPKLYDVRLSAGGDSVSDRVGFRRIERVGDEIRLNGKALFLRGISVHEDDAVHGKVTSEDDLRRRFAHARELNCNYLRLAHYPHHERAAEIAAFKKQTKSQVTMLAVGGIVTVLNTGTTRFSPGDGCAWTFEPLLSPGAQQVTINKRQKIGPRLIQIVRVPPGCSHPRQFGVSKSAARPGEHFDVLLGPTMC